MRIGRNTCLKTGGILVFVDEDRYYECDLHAIGDMIVAVTSHPQFKEPDRSRITVTLVKGADVIFRDANPFGMLVVRRSECIPSERLRMHLIEWYPPNYNLGWGVE